MKKLTGIFGIILSFALASIFSLSVHEGGHAFFANQYGADVTDYHLLWLTVRRGYDNEGNLKPWQWKTAPWKFGEGYLGYTSWYTNGKITTSEDGIISLMGSGSSFLLAVIIMGIMYLRKRPKRFPWLGAFIVFMGIVDIFTYSVIPMIGTYARIEKGQGKFNLVCSNEIIDLPHLSDKLQVLPAPFDPRVSLINSQCGYYHNAQTAIVSLAVEYDGDPEIEWITYLFAQIATPEGEKWYLSEELDDLIFKENYLVGDVSFNLPPVSGEYEVKDAFLVINGLKRLIFFYGDSDKDGYAMVEPLYGAVDLGINPFYFMAFVTISCIILAVFLIRYIVKYRRENP